MRRRKKKIEEEPIQKVYSPPGVEIMEQPEPVKPPEPVKRLSLRERALEALGLAEVDIFASKEYPDKFVFVTRAGKKRIWEKR